MNIAVLTLTRDRLEYTRDCFASLEKYAGCPYDHYILDQGSSDGTIEWLTWQYAARKLFRVEANIGISRGMNVLLENLEGDYDVIVKFDNDCELVQPNTLKRVCELVMVTGWILSPKIKGLNHPPIARAKYRLGGVDLLEIPQIGGIFLAAPAKLYESFRFNENNPKWGADDVEICQGRRCGYVDGIEAWHYESTAGQHERYPTYFARTLAEGKPTL